MNSGKTLFAQLMEFVPWKAFGRIIIRHGGDAGVRTLSCAEIFRIMAFSQLTWRESLRDIEVCLAANQAKLFHMGLKQVPARSTLSDALNSRDWRIYHALAMRLIMRAKALYIKEPNGLDTEATIYALDSTTIDLCLSLFDWAPFRSTKAAIKMHTLLDLRGNIPAFIHISDGKMADVNVLDFLPIEAGAFYIMDRGYVDFARLYVLHQAGAFFVTRAKRGMSARRVYSKNTDRTTGVICDQLVMLNGFYSSQEYPVHLRRIRYKDQRPGVRKNTDFLDQQYGLATPNDCFALQEPLASRAFLQMDQATSENQAFSGHKRECRKDSNLVRSCHLYANRYCQKGTQPRRLTLHIATDFVGVDFRENPYFYSVSTRGIPNRLRINI